MRRTLRVDGLETAGALGTAAICTVISAHNQETGEITAPGRVVGIKVDSLHTTTPFGKGYDLAEQAATVSEGWGTMFFDRGGWKCPRAP